MDPMHDHHHEHHHDHDHDHVDHGIFHVHNHSGTSTAADATMNLFFMSLNHLELAKLLTMLVLCSVSFILGVIPLRLVKYLTIKVPSCAMHSHDVESKQPLIISLLLCFGGGVLLFTTFLHLEPEVREAMERMAQDGQLPAFVQKHNLHFADLIFCAGFFLVYIIEEVVHFFLDLGTGHEDEAALHRTMSLRRCAKHSFPSGKAPGTMIPRVSLTNTANKTDVPDSSLFSVSTTSRQVLLENGANGTMAKRQHHHHHLHADTMPQISTAASSTDADTESMAGSSQAITTKRSFRGLFAILALSFHEVFEGLAVGLEQHVQSVWYLLAAIATHKFVLSFCLGVELVSSRTKTPLVLLYICTFAIVTPIGITVGILLLRSDSGMPQNNLVTIILQGIACGTLLYVTFFEILQREKANAKSGILQLLAILLGFAFMLCMQFLAGHEHTHNHGGHNESHSHHHDGYD